MNNKYISILLFYIINFVSVLPHFVSSLHIYGMIQLIFYFIIYPLTVLVVTFYLLIKKHSRHPIMSMIHILAGILVICLGLFVSYLYAIYLIFGR